MSRAIDDEASLDLARPLYADLNGLDDEEFARALQKQFYEENVAHICL
jgi:hypothetical protein